MFQHNSPIKGASQIWNEVEENSESTVNNSKQSWKVDIIHLLEDLVRLVAVTFFLVSPDKYENTLLQTSFGNFGKIKSIFL